MTEEFRIRVVGIVKKWNRQNGRWLNLSQFRDAMRLGGISDEEANANLSGQLKPLINSEIPELRLVGNPGQEQVVVWENEGQRIYELIIGKMGTDRRILFSDVGDLLKKENVNWRGAGKGYHRLFDYLSAVCPGAFNENQPWLELKTKNSIDPTLNICTNISTRDYVFKFCFMPTDSTILSQVRAWTHNSELTLVEWNAYRIDALARCLIGLNGGILDDSRGELPKLAYHTGMRTSQGQDIYAILRTNPNEGAPQKWIFSSIAFPGQDNEEGRWLCKAFGIHSQKFVGEDRSKAVLAVTETLNGLKSQQETLHAMMTNFSVIIETGQAIPKDIGDLFADYIGKWRELEHSLENLGVSVSEITIDFGYVQGLLDEWNNASSIQKQLTDQFRKLVTQTWEFMTMNTLATVESSADKDIKQWSEIVAKCEDEDGREKLENLLKPFQSLLVLRDWSCSGTVGMGERELQAYEILRGYFGIQVYPKSFADFISRYDLSFLETISSIHALLKQLINMKNRQCREIANDDMLLEAALNGEMWLIMETTTSRANIWEEAIMAGDEDALHNFVENPDLICALGYDPSCVDDMVKRIAQLVPNSAITPVNAAERLDLILGKSCSVIDWCLLLGVAQGEARAIEKLIAHYIETDRLDLAGRMLREYSSRIHFENQDKWMPKLLFSGNISVDWALEISTPSLLTEQGIQFVRSMDPLDTRREHLLDLFEKIRSPLIHHIVFLNPELQSYVMRYEKSDENEPYIPDVSYKSIVETLRHDAFERGYASLQVAKRVYAFVGDLDGIAEQFALISPESMERQVFLLDLYKERNEVDKILKMLESDHRLWADHVSYFIDILYRKERYQELCDAAPEIEGYEVPTKGKMQMMLAHLFIEGRCVLTADLDLREAVLSKELLLKLSYETAQVDKSQHIQLVIRVFDGVWTHLSDDEIREFVTANETLSTDDLYAMANAAKDICPSLTVFCSKLINTSDFDAVTEAYLAEKYRQFGQVETTERLVLIHELRNLNPENSVALMESLLEHQMTEVLRQSTPADKKAQRILELLRGCVLSAEGFKKILYILKGHEVVAHDGLYQQLMTMASDEEECVMCLRLIHGQMNKGGKSLVDFLCQCYIEFDERGILPADLWDECEKILLSQPLGWKGYDTYRCVLHIEQERGRDTYAKYAQYAIDIIFQSDADETTINKNRIAEIEMQLICDALRDDRVDIEDYLRYCGAFIMPSSATCEEDGGSPKNDSLKVIRSLYQKPCAAENWDAFEKIIPHDWTDAHAYVVFQYASCYKTIEKAKVLQQDGTTKEEDPNDVWERCVRYCLTENYPILFFRALRRWLQIINDSYTKELPWFAMKNYSKAVQGILESRDIITQNEKTQILEFPSCDTQTAEEIVGAAIATLKRINWDNDNIYGGDDNHQLLRWIIELGLRLDCEELLIRELAGELTGQYVNLGLVMICRLLLGSKFNVAKQFILRYKNTSIKDYNYSALVDELVILSQREDNDGLKEWLTEESHVETLKFILPNGNVPDIFRLQRLIMSSFVGDAHDRELCAKVIERLLDCYPNDKMCYKALFIVCKEDYTNNIKRIYRALEGVYKFYGKDRAKFTRDRFAVVKLISVLHRSMEAMGFADFTHHSAVDLLQEYSLFATPDARANKISELIQTENDINSYFAGINQGTSEYGLRLHSSLATVTGNWLPFIKKAYSEQTTPSIGRYIRRDYGTWGLLRGLLRMWRELSGDDKKTFFSWVQTEVEQDPQGVIGKYIFKDFSNIVNQMPEDTVNWSLLRLPWEEHMVCLGNLKDLDRPEMNCCYKLMMAERPKGRSAYNSFILMLCLAQDDLRVKMLTTFADQWFQEEDYSLAGAAYDALSSWRPTPRRDLSQEQNQQLKEKWETMMRISYVFAGENLDSMTCSSHSCMNMMVTLLNSGNTTGFDKLRSFFKNGNADLFRAVKRVLTSALGQEDLKRMLNEFDPANQNSEIETSRYSYVAFLHFLLSKDITDNYLFVTNQNFAEWMTAKLNETKAQLSNHQRTVYWIPLKIKLETGCFMKLEDSDSDETAEEPDNFIVDLELLGGDTTPKFVSDIEKYADSNTESCSVRELMAKHNALTTYLDAEYLHRLGLAARICLVCRESGEGYEQAVVRFGINYYNHIRSQINRSETPELGRRELRRIMLDLAVYGLKTPSVSFEVSKVLPGWFQYSVRCQASLDNLLEDMSRNRQGYMAIAQLLSDTEYSYASKHLFALFNTLLIMSNQLGTKSIDIQSYMDVQRKLNDIKSPIDWTDMYSVVNEWLRQKINTLDQNPTLRVTVFNNESGLQYDAVYGEIENIGKKSAHHLEIQATFPNSNWHHTSAVYQLDILRPGEKATFAISYSVEEGQTELQYILNTSYFFQDVQEFVLAYQGKLTIQPNRKSETNEIPHFETESAFSFSKNNQKKIFSEGFVGRKSEILKLTNLLSGDDFSQYKSAIVQGIKRAGKTSLLNYLRTFIREEKSENTICIYVDGQGIGKPYIYKSFFGSVFDEIITNYSHVMSNPRWTDFYNRWYKSENAPDFHPGEMIPFFKQLHQLLDGKGIYLIVDEFDALLAKINRETGYDDLLRALRSLQMDQDCFKAVHMLLCGSNRLLVYNRTGSAFNQMFQSYRMIPVGEMQMEDIREMILDKLGTSSPVHVLEGQNGAISPTIQWIERYTGGLVWYTRLLLNKAIENVTSAGRNCIYPSDVCNAFPSICDYNTCLQLTDGCEREELLVLDAVQKLANQTQGYVTLEQISQVIGSRMNREQVISSLDVLTNSIALLEKRAPSIWSYRFRKELYRRFFRSGTPELHFQKPDDVTGNDIFSMCVEKSTVVTSTSDSAFD